jgi:elongation factor 4
MTIAAILNRQVSRSTRSVTIILRRRPTRLLIRHLATTSETRLLSIIEHHELIHKIPLEDVRNFCFIAHVDHGKSSLASRVLELTGNLGPEAQKIAWDATFGDPNATGVVVEASQKENINMLDTLSVEKERGITVKASTATMLYPHPAAVGPEGVLLLNMLDTPGHVDFGREVSRSLTFVQGAVLLLDASQGIQAQTWSVYEKAKSLPNPPQMLVALTKVDLDAARPIQVALTVSEWLNLDDPDAIITTSARNRVGITDILDAVCRQVPAPTPLEDDDGEVLRAQVVDSWYDSRGVNCLVQIVSGSLNESDRISIVADRSQQAFSVQEVGILLPRTLRTGFLQRGQMGYVRFGLKDPRQAQPGTVLMLTKHASKQAAMIIPTLPESLQAKSVLYASVHPMDSDGFEDLCQAVEKLALNDTGLDVAKTGGGSSSNERGGPFLGPGLRVGFQGLLHVEVFRQRLTDEFGLEAIVTPPKVPYTVTYEPSKNSSIKEAYTEVIEDLDKWPLPGLKFTIEEPVVETRIMAPQEYAGSVMELIKRKRGTRLESRPIDDETWLFTARMPWGELVTDFHDELKNVTAGMGSLDTFEGDPPLQEAKLVKVDILLNDEVVEPLAFVCHADEAQGQARVVCKKLQEVLPRQQFVTVIQAKAASKIIASERIKAYRKDVLTTGGSKSVGGGDVSRKKKLLEKQKKGKKRQQSSGKVSLSQEAFNSVISRST